MIVLSKRDLLRVLVGVAALSAAPSQAGARVAVPSALAGIDAVGAARIGRAWLGGGSTTAAGLAAHLFPTGLDEGSLRQLAARVHADFQSGDLFVHDGWMMSRTEARLCALIALS